MDLIEHFSTIKDASVGILKDRGSVFHAYAWPVSSEEEALEHLNWVKKEHFKARHHCFAWRIGVDGALHRANDDGEPSGTAGRPILGQIDSKNLTNVFIVVVRYFGGTLLGTSGLINAYRGAAADALEHAELIVKTVETLFEFTFDYAFMPDFMQAVKTMDLHIHKEEYGNTGMMHIGIPCTTTDDILCRLRAAVLKVSLEEAAVSSFPAGMKVEDLGNLIV